MQRRNEIILQKIVKEIDSATKFLGEKTEEEFLQNAESMIAIKIGEFVKNLTMEFRESHKEISWKKVAGFRDIVAYRYETLEMENVYHTIKFSYPELKMQIEKIFGEWRKKIL